MNQPIRALIVDDEPLAREGIHLLLAEDEDITVVAECANGEEAVEAIEMHRPDLVFLDVQMPGLDGFEVLRRIRSERMPLVVFVTAFDKFAIPAFEAHALDYVLKPVVRRRFKETLRFVKKRHKEKTASELTHRILSMLADKDPQLLASSVTRKYPDRIPIRQGDRIQFVTVSEIDWIEAAENYVNLHAGRATHLMRGSLTALEKKLDPKQFTRIHRSTIVNVGRIKELQQHFQGEYFVILHDKTRLKLSRTYRESLATIFGSGI